MQEITRLFIEKLIKIIDEGSVDIYLTRSDFSNELAHELTGILFQSETMIVAKANQLPVFARDCWRSPHVMSIASIGDAVKKLKAIQPFWYLHKINESGRSQLIVDQLPQYKKVTPHHFPLQQLPAFGVFSLLDKHTLLYTAKRDKPVPDGYFDFVEDKMNPPNRAYLKLWEALVLLGRYPKVGELGVDLGASPGGWTWVLQSCGANVLAIDKAPLAASVAALPRVESRIGSAFALTPNDVDHVDWLVCDVACYPERLYEWLQPWLVSGKVKQFILTLKLQGETDFEIIRQFQSLPNVRVLQLQHNKHEVTVFLPGFV